MLKTRQPQKFDEQQRAQELLIEEAVENMHNEQLSQFWKKYKYLIYTLIIAIVVGVAGMEAYKTHKNKMHLADSDAYEQAVVLNAKGQTNEALAKYETLKDAKTNYKYLSMIRRAGILFEQNEPNKALALLKAVHEDKSAPEVLKAVCAFGLASNQIDTLPPEQVHSLIAPYLMATSPWYSTAVELEITLLEKQGKTKEATSLIDQALTVSSMPASAKERLTILKKALSGK